MKRFWELAKCATVGVLRARARSVLTMAGITIASGSLLCMLAFVIGLKAQIETPFEQLGLLNNVEVTLRDDDQAAPPNHASNDQNGVHSGVDVDPDSQQPVDSSLPLDDSAIEQFESLEHVDYAYADFRLASVKVVRGESTANSFAMGLPREASLTGYLDTMLVAGRFFSLNDSAEVMLGVENVERLGFASPESAVGQTVTLVAEGLQATESSDFTYDTQSLELTIAGVFEPPSFASRFGGGAIIMPVDLMRNLPGTIVEDQLRRLRSGTRPGGGYSRVVVRVDSPSHVHQVEQELRDLGYDTFSMISRMQEARKFFLIMELILGAVGTVALVVAGLGILNTQLMTVMERHREIGLYKAMGASDGDVRLLFLTEAALLGTLGALAGIVLAWLASVAVERVFLEYAKREAIEGPIVAFQFPLWLLGMSVGYALTISIVSGLYPASRAARVDPIQALRGE